MGLIAAGPDGALWFATFCGIGRATTTGVVTAYPTPCCIGNWPITAGPDGALWFAAFGYGGTVIGRGPACGLGFSANYANGALIMNFNLGVDSPADFKIVLHNSTGPFAEPLSRSISPVVPPRAFSITFSELAVSLRDGREVERLR